MQVLVTGGAGYIGSHTTVELLNSGYEVVVIDNFSNSSPEVIKRVESITGRKIKLYIGDVKDKRLLDKVFSENKIDSVISFAGYKAVGESCEKPLEYYENNVESLLALCLTMKEHKVKNIVFSSTATVYGKPKSVPVKEDDEISTFSPYATSKMFIEKILTDLYEADKTFNVAILRYFNPIGAHESGLIGEDPKGIPNNLCPYITQVAIGKREFLGVYGNDYDTPDGTGVRDYIHVVDLAKGHVLALKKLQEKCGLFVVNLGTGKGYSVLDVVHAFERVSGKRILYKILPRRAGDVDEYYADVTKAKKLLGFVAQKTIDDMCKDALNWQIKNPNGYEG